MPLYISRIDANEYTLLSQPIIVGGARSKLSLAGLTAAMISAGIPVDMLPDLSPRKPRIFTLADEERMQAAEQKRQRKAAKRLKQGGK